MAEEDQNSISYLLGQQTLFIKQMNAQLDAQNEVNKHLAEEIRLLRNFRNNGENGERAKIGNSTNDNKRHSFFSDISANQNIKKGDP